MTGSEVVSDPDDSVVASLRAQIEVILNGARRQGLISMLAGYTGNERRNCLIAGLVVGLILTLFMVVPLLFPVARSLVDLVILTTLVFMVPFSIIFAIMMTFVPWAPVLLLQPGRVTGRTKLQPKPGPIAEL
jgi:hypothetical protein